MKSLTNQLKICSICTKELPITEYYLQSNHKNYCTYCKKCTCVKTSTYLKGVPEKVKIWSKKCRLKYREKYNEKCKEWYRHHAESEKQKSSEWRKNNPTRHRLTKSIWTKRKRKTDFSFRFAEGQRTRMRQLFKEKNISKILKTFELVGCSFPDLKKYITDKFREDMSWKNHGRFGWHVDHIKPLVSFDFNDPEQIKQAFHYTNLQPLWWYENLKKGSKIAIAV